MADLASQPTVIQSLYSWFREGKLYVNRQYQRKLVWTLEEKQKLIESIQKQYPIPAILLSERSDGSGIFEIIDGLQRLHAIFSFIENSFPDLEDNFFDVSQFATAKTYADDNIFEVESSAQKLSAKGVSTILDYTLALSIMRNSNDEEINDVFDRINTYGHRLSDQERRQAGVSTSFSTLVRTLACSVRGDVSVEKLPLYDMPSISIDLPKMQHGYDVRADEVFWVDSGVLRSTDLRDSLDEQVIADLIACVVGPELITRSKVTLDELYNSNSKTSSDLASQLEVYGPEKMEDEFKYVLAEIIKMCGSGGEGKLKEILFNKPNSNSFPSIFSFIFLALHEKIIAENKKISDYKALKDALTDCGASLTQGQKATAPAERRKNVNIVKGLMEDVFVDDKDPRNHIYVDASLTDIENWVRRSGMELSNYELKQGILRLDGKNEIDDNVVEKIFKTACAMANIGPNNTGKIILGVCDSPNDAERILEIHGVSGKQVASRTIVGIRREAEALNWTIEEYFQYLRDQLSGSGLSEPLKSGILTNLDFNSYYELGILVIKVPPMDEPSYLDEEMFWREGDQTILAKSAKDIATIVQRF
ncbi:MAG: DUF262 domain-containing protein [Rhizobiaceae bacterium]|nr:DUF262 domain-containing protein [Rhizobiaceae bacterium]